MDALDQGGGNPDGAEDTYRGRHVSHGGGRRERAIGRTHHRDAGKYRRYRTASRCAVRIHCLRARRQHQEGRGASDYRRRQDDGLRGLPWRGSERPGPGARNRRSIAQLHDAPDVRYAAGRSQRRMDRSDETGGQQAERRRHAGDFGVHGVADAVKATFLGYLKLNVRLKANGSSDRGWAGLEIRTRPLGNDPDTAATAAAAGRSTPQRTVDTPSWRERRTHRIAGLELTGNRNPLPQPLRVDFRSTKPST